ncbi:HupE/UreJ family protein [Prosthecomicrobium sp. N25]|uniref:HupE/UreJ family protein n=1 Tax=Prosthecomicrobium sp. N25 TaxID=3129254 RepID=UPI0030785516
MKWTAILVAVLAPLLALSAPRVAHAHEVRPAYLDLVEERPGEFSVLWKTPMQGEMRLALAPVFSGPVDLLAPVATKVTGDAAVQTWRIRADGLRGMSLRIVGLEGTLTDVLARITFADSSTWVVRLTPREPEAVVPARPSGWSVASTYLALGVEHILTGVDHLLFVLALLLLTSGPWRLAKTVTAFTLAHSITLALATLGIVRVPPKPVEAVIALSIVFVASEILRNRREKAGWSERMPWLVAFTFGLLHGFGFAGALSDVGLPDGQIPVALLFFNVGVEAGQLLFIGGVLVMAAGLQRLRIVWPRWSVLATPYAIGSLAMFWMIQRLAAF